MKDFDMKCSVDIMSNLEVFFFFSMYANDPTHITHAVIAGGQHQRDDTLAMILDRDR